MIGRFNKFLLYLGYSPESIRDMKVQVFCKTISEFALEYRTTREKVLQLREKKANQRERKKTRGKMIVEARSTCFVHVGHWCPSCLRLRLELLTLPIFRKRWKTILFLLALTWVGSTSESLSGAI